MQYTIVQKEFSSFNEASQYARNIAIANKVNVKVVRNGNIFVVTSDSNVAQNIRTVPKIISRSRVKSSYSKKQRKKCSKYEIKQAKKEEEKEKEKNRFLASSVIKQRRKSYLDKRKIHYENLTKEKLDEIWSDREKTDLKADEIMIIRNILRDRIGIKTVGDVHTRINFCLRCSLPVNSCTCEKGWW